MTTYNVTSINSATYRMARSPIEGSKSVDGAWPLKMLTARHINPFESWERYQVQSMLNCADLPDDKQMEAVRRVYDIPTRIRLPDASVRPSAGLLPRLRSFFVSGTE